MRDNAFQDVIPKNGGRSIRNIPLSESRMRFRPRKAVAPLEEKEILPPEPPREMPEIDDFDEEAQSGWRRWKKSIIAGLVIFVIILGFAISSIFHSAKVIARVHNVEATVAGDVFTAKKAAGALEMPLEILMVKKVGEAIVKSTGEEQVERRASGSIVIFNNHSTAPQRLIKNTRFESQSGLTYRVDSSVTVPGKTAAGPGSIEAVVFADEPGEKYNIGLTDFTIPGFKGDPRYETFYGRSKTPMTQGFKGSLKVVSDTDKAKAKETIESKVVPELVTEIKGKVPEGFVLYPDLWKIEWLDLPQESLGGDEVKMKMEATMTAILFDEKALSSFLAFEHVKDYKGADIRIKNISELLVKPVKPDIFNPNASTIDFSITGTPIFVWQFDEGALRQDLAGKKSEDIPKVLANFSTAIENITPRFSPFWRKSFPDNIEKIKVEIVLR